MQKYPDHKSSQSLSRRRRRSRSGGLQHIGVERRTIHGEAWKALIPPAKIFYIHLKARYNGSNNGEIKLSYADMRGVKGCSSNDSITKAIKELETKEWIVITKKGGLYRYENLFKLTFKHDLYGYQ